MSDACACNPDPKSSLGEKNSEEIAWCGPPHPELSKENDGIHWYGTQPFLQGHGAGAGLAPEDKGEAEGASPPPSTGSLGG